MFHSGLCCSAVFLNYFAIYFFKTVLSRWRSWYRGLNKIVLRFYCIVLMFDRIIRLSPRESEKNVLSSRLQRIGLFLKISKEIGKAWRLPHTPYGRVRRETKKPSISIASPWNVVYKVEDQKWVEVAVVRQQSLCLLLEGGVSRKSRALRINCRISKHSSAILWVDG